jgi:hypothetical protein
VPLDPLVTEYSPQHAAHLAKLAEAAYRPFNPMTLAALEQAGYSARLVQRNGTEVLVLTDRQNLILAFRGTEPGRLRDLCADARICLEPGPSGSKIHSGFRGALREVERDLLDLIRTEGQGRARWLTGHSLGGALAILCAGLAKLALGEVVQGVYAFAPPRVGNQKWVDAYRGALGSRTWWFAREGDGVVRLPPRALGYRHLTGGRQYLMGGRIVEGEGPWLMALTRTFDPLEAFVPGSGAFEDHSARRYVADLEGLARA